MSYSSLGTLAAIVLITGEIVLRIAALGIIPRNRKPTAGMAWLLVILFDPWIGFFFFLFFGSARVGGKRRAKQAEINQLIKDRTASIADPAVDASPLVTTFLHLNRELGALPPAMASTVELFPDYLDSMAAMTKAIDTAQTRVHVEFYISDLDDTTRDFFRALADASEPRGEGAVPLRPPRLAQAARPQGDARVLHHPRHRVVPDDAGPAPARAVAPARPTQPPQDPRRRRPDRLLRLAEPGGGVVRQPQVPEDGPQVGRPDGPGHRHDRGGARRRLRQRLVHRVRRDDRREARGRRRGGGPEAITDVTCQVVPSGPGFPSENNLRLFTSLLASAARRISITSPYFIPDESLLYASRPRPSAVSTWSSSSTSSPTSSWSATPRRRTTTRCWRPA